MKQLKKKCIFNKIHEFDSQFLTNYRGVSEIIFKEESYEIIGACMEVHTLLGMGFKEAIYKDALDLELTGRQIVFKREVSFSIQYKGITLPRRYYADFVIDSSIILEIKAVPQIINPFVYQTINYLKASGIKLGIIINFGEKSLNYKRVVF